MANKYQQRKKISFTVLIIIGLLIGLAIKRVGLGIIIGIVLGLLGSGMVAGRKDDDTRK